MVPVAGVDGPTYRPARARKPLLEVIGDGTGGRTRTGTLLRASDFESDVSTNSTTPAQGVKREVPPLESARL